MWWLTHRGIETASECSARQTSFLGEFLECPRTFGCLVHASESPRYLVSEAIPALPNRTVDSAITQLKHVFIVITGCSH